MGRYCLCAEGAGAWLHVTHGLSLHFLARIADSRQLSILLQNTAAQLGVMRPCRISSQSQSTEAWGVA